jgi:hydroxymethylbilane synthase
VRDALVSHNGADLGTLPPGARLGTASLRREALVRRARPDFSIELIRGNVPTRLRRVEEGEFDATLLAAAGLRRLGLEARITAMLPLQEFPPACGQGAVAVECRAEDARMRDLIAAIDHRETSVAVTCERAFLAVLDGSCRTPVAGHARMADGALSFDGILLSPDGREFYETSLSGSAAGAAELGRAAGQEIRARAPKEFLQALGIG